MTLRDEPCFQELAEDFRKFVGQQNFIEILNTGNWGDGLIHAGQEQFFRDIGLVPTRRISILDWKARAPWKLDFWRRLVWPILVSRNLVFNGCGGLRPFYDRPKELEKAAKRFSKLFIFPSSLTFKMDLDPESTVFWRRDNLESLEATPQARFCHDMAFYLSPKPRTATKPIAFMFRADIEKADFELPPDNLDLSNEGTHASDPEEFLDRVGEFEVIHTNRLHIGIAGALLGREVHLYESRTRKLESIYKSSFEPHYKNVHYHATPPAPSLFAKQ